MGWWFEPAEVERFVREASWLYDVRRMRPGHRLTRLAETTHRADPWIAGQDAIGRALGLAPTNLKKWIARELVPHRRRPVAGAGGELVVRGRDVPAIREAIAEARERIRLAGVARFTAMRRERIAS